MAKPTALERALRLIGYRLRSRQELVKALEQRGYKADDITQAVGDLERIGLVDDKQFASALARTRVQVSRRGRHAIFFELLKLGIDRDLIDEVLSQIDPEDELTAAKNLLAGRQRLWADLDFLTRKRRAISLLQRRGFNSKIIRQVMDELS